VRGNPPRHVCIWHLARLVLRRGRQSAVAHEPRERVCGVDRSSGRTTTVGKSSTSLADGYLFFIGILEEIGFHLAVLMPLLLLMATTNDNIHSTIDTHTPCSGTVYCCRSFERRYPFKGCQAIPLRSNIILSSCPVYLLYISYGGSTALPVPVATQSATTRHSMRSE